MDVSLDKETAPLPLALPVEHASSAQPLPFTVAKQWIIVKNNRNNSNIPLH